MQYRVGRLRGLRTRLLCAVCGGWLLSTMSAYAQDEGVESGPVEDEDVIVVTGSRIARDANIDAPTSVVTVTSENIALQGSSNLADILREVPSNGQSALTGTNSNFTVASAGINTIDLRDLGESRTLILVNSKRFVAGIPGTQIVDLNQIPTALVERVEIITGGASAIYGSDALAGVVNIILKEDFEGVETEVQYGKDAFGTNEEMEAALTVGGNFDNGRGNAVTHFNWVQNLGVPAASRPDLQTDGAALCALTGVIADCNTRFEPVFSTFSDQGRFVVDDFNTGQSSEFTVRNGQVVPFNGAIDGFNRQPFRMIKPSSERFLIGSTATYDVLPWMTVFLEGTYASTQAVSRLEPVPLESGDIFDQGTATGVPVFIPDGKGGTMPNPFIPDDLFNIAVAGNEESIGFARRLVEVGPRGTDFLRETFRAVAGLKGEFQAFDDRSYLWETFFNYGRTVRQQEQDSSVITPNFAAALDIEPVDPDDLSKGFQCRDELARVRGCVPINIFGKGAISPEAADFVRGIESRVGRVRQEQYGGTLTGPLPYFSLPAGDIKMALGVEYRRESSSDQPDGLIQSGLSSTNQIAGEKGSFNVFESFAEMEVPILKDLPFAYELTVGGAARYSEYSVQGETWAYSARASFAPVRPLRFRFQYARAVRAPNISELFAVGGENFAPVNDPCNNLDVGNPSDPLVANCLADPAIAARVGATGQFVLTGSEEQAAGGFSGVGNPNVEPEIGDSYALGFVFDESFGKAGHVTFSVDWFDIFIDGAIFEPGRNFAVNQCYQAGRPEFCAMVERDGTGLPTQQGEIVEVNTSVVNAGFLSKAGVDIAVNWSFDINDWHKGGALGLSDLGSVNLNILYTYLYESENEVFEVFDNDVGTLGNFEHEIQGTVTYRNGPLTVQWQTFYNDGGPLTSPGEDAFFNAFILDEYVKSDIQFRYTLFGGGVDLFFGIDNVLDADTDQVLPFLPGNDIGTNTATETYDPIGRSYYGGVKARF